MAEVVDNAIAQFSVRKDHDNQAECPARWVGKATPLTHWSFIPAPSRLEGHSSNLHSTGPFVSGQSCTYPTSTERVQDVDSTVFNGSQSLESVVEAEEVRKSNRPSNGKRNRYKKFVRSLESQILANPDLFDLDKIDFPPSLQANDKQRCKLMQRLLEFKHQAKTGEVAESHWIKI